MDLAAISIPHIFVDKKRKEIYTFQFDIAREGQGPVNVSPVS